MDAAGNAPEAKVHPSVVNNVFNSMWRDHKISMNGRQITEPNNMYAWRALMEDILNFSMDVKTRDSSVSVGTAIRPGSLRFGTQR